MTDRELLQMALDALELLARYENPSTKVQVRKPRDGGPIVTMYPHKVATEAAVPLRARLAQPEPEPVAWGIANTRPTEKKPLMMVMLDEPEPSHLVIPLYTAPPQREVYCGCGDEIVAGDGARCGTCVAVKYKEKEWQGLTKEEYEAMAEKCVTNCYFDTLKYARAIEARLRDKNS